MKTKPSTEFQIDQIPEELTGVARWVNWKAEPIDDGKWTKVPCCSSDPALKAKTSDPSTWSALMVRT